ncbi:MAG: hypothetical protein L6R42_004533 [Xanthoria sp. 1 TBL-2021]|nr:MAG: hypothetical protein L6R42_004533 [Xanthoria sp. 1 TBL-2021]
MAENPKLRAWRIRVLAEKNKLSNFAEVAAPIGPSMVEVINVKRLLLVLKLPLEIVDLILDHAEFWPHTTCTSQYRTVVFSSETERPDFWIRDWRSLPFSMDHGPIPQNYKVMPNNAFLLRAHPLGLETREPVVPVKASVMSRWKQKLKRDRRRKSSCGPTWLPPRGLRPCRKVIFEILSHQEAVDLSEPQYGDSPTWFDVSVERILPEEGTSGPITWTAPMNEEWGDDILGYTEGSTEVQVLKKVPGAEAPLEKLSRQASPTGSAIDDNPVQHFETRRTKPTLAAKTRQDVVQQNYQGDPVHRQHVVTWRYDEDLDPESFEADGIVTETGTHANGDFIRKLETGESIVLWARARFRPRKAFDPTAGADPCINVVDRVRMHVFWAI